MAPSLGGIYSGLLPKMGSISAFLMCDSPEPVISVHGDMQTRARGSGLPASRRLRVRARARLPPALSPTTRMFSGL